MNVTLRFALQWDSDQAATNTDQSQATGTASEEMEVDEDLQQALAMSMQVWASPVTWVCFLPVVIVYTTTCDNCYVPAG